MTRHSDGCCWASSVRQEPHVQGGDHVHQGPPGRYDPIPEALLTDDDTECTRKEHEQRSRKGSVVKVQPPTR